MFVSVAPCADYEPQTVRRALEELLAPPLLDWVRPGMTVGIKANLVSMMKPETAATTHPALLCALVAILRERGAEVVIGDSPGGVYTALYVDRVYRVTGMKEAEAAGARLNRDFSVCEAEFPEARAAKTFQYTGWLDRVDAIIDFCKLKTHGMMSMSAAAKNMFGAVPGTVKPEYHYRFPEPADFADMLVDLNEYFRPRLSITDAVIGMEGNGPTAGTPRKIGLLLASESPHAADLIGAALIGLTPQKVPTLAAAIRRGLIPETPEELETRGADWRALRIPDYQLVETVRSLRFNKDSEKFFGKWSARVADRFLASRPALKSAACVGCGKCREICPAHAIRMMKKRPVIDRAACIRCFCCQEFCPKGALRVQRPLVARIVTK